MDDEVAAAEHWTDGLDDVVFVLAVFLACKLNIVGLLYARMPNEELCTLTLCEVGYSPLL